VKEANLGHLRGSEVNAWLPPTGDTKGLPVEVLAPIRLRGKIGSECVAMIRNYKLSADHGWARIFMECCPMGTLGQLMKPYERLKREKQHEDNACVPEPFIWHAFESLARVGMLMEKAKSTATPFSHWSPATGII
jgi:hypothetical protein